MAGPYYNSYMPQLPQQMQNMPYMQSYGMQQMGPQYPMQMQPGIQARYVTGREEAVAAQIPQDGNMCIFADTGHGMIFTKQLNMQDGSAVFRAYRLVENPTGAEKQAEEYAKKSEFDRLRADFDELMRQLTAPMPQKQQKHGGENE